MTAPRPPDEVPTWGRDLLDDALCSAVWSLPASDRLPVVAGRNCGTAAGRELAVIYADSKPSSAEDVASRATLVTTSGGRAWAEAGASWQFAWALDEMCGVARRATGDRRTRGAGAGGDDRDL